MVKRESSDSSYASLTESVLEKLKADFGCPDQLDSDQRAIIEDILSRVAMIKDGEFDSDESSSSESVFESEMKDQENSSVRKRTFNNRSIELGGSIVKNENE